MASKTSGCTRLVAPPLSSASLLSVELVGCEALTADALHATLRRSPELRSLDIRGCDTVGASLGPSAALQVPERLLTQLSLTAEPALESLFFTMAARASAEELEEWGRGSEVEEEDEQQQWRRQQAIEHRPEQTLSSSFNFQQDPGAAMGDAGG